MTVEQALRRDVQVMAVPGSVRNKAACGTNQLLVDGCAPVRDVTDVLVALGLSEIAAATRRNEPEVKAPELPVGPVDSPGYSAVGIGHSAVGIGYSAVGIGHSASVSGRAAVVLEAIDDGPTSVNEGVDRSGLGVVEVYGLVEELVAMGLVVHDGSRVRRQY